MEARRCPKCGSAMEERWLAFCSGIIVLPRGQVGPLKGWVCESCGYLEAEGDGGGGRG